MEWVIIKNQNDLRTLEEMIGPDALIREVYAHAPIPSEQPAGASGSGNHTLDTRVLIFLPEEPQSYLEVVFDFTEHFGCSFSSAAELNFRGRIDSMGRFTGSLFSDFENEREDIIAGRLRYRRIILDADQCHQYFRSIGLL